MKKFLALLLILSLSAFTCFSCTPNEDPSDPGTSEDGPNIDENGWTNS